jgi:Tol biopolymer transport system component
MPFGIRNSGRQIGVISGMVSLRFVLLIPALAFLETATPFQMIAQTPRQEPGTIVFVHAPDGGAPWPVEDIYSIDRDGTNVKALTNDGHSHGPAWSSDGRRVLFIHDSALQTKPAYKEEKEFDSYHPVELYVMDRDGGNRHLLRRMEPVIYGAVWSPDGKTLAVSCIPEASANRSQSDDEPAHAGLFLLPADARGEPRLLFQDALTPAWSPDGKKLAFSVERPRGQWAVHIANSDGSNDAQLTEPALMAGSPAWSPDGRLIAFDAGQRNQQIFVMDADGSRQRQVTTDSNWSCGHPTWSADGSQLAFSCRSASTPCGGVSSVGTVLPECARRLFAISTLDSPSKPIQLSEHDAAMPAFAPIR